LKSVESNFEEWPLAGQDDRDEKMHRGERLFPTDQGLSAMPTLDDFLDPLFNGVKEVIVPKSEVTEQLDQEWKESKINVPSPNMVTSYRKGRLHVHEFEEDYRVHLDRYDPDKSPLLHLVDDAPLLLMVWGTVSALSTEAVSTQQGKRDRRLSALRFTYRTRIILGALAMVIGALVLVFPYYTAMTLFSIILPLIIVGLGAFTVYQGIKAGIGGKARAIKVAIGAIIMILGFWMWGSWKFAAIIIVLVLVLWFLGSALLSLTSAMKERRRSNTGFWPKFAMGALSLALGVAVLFMPKAVIGLLMLFLGVIAILAGILLVLDGLGLRRASKDFARTTSDE
jgi:uncharacterized membrane protein HdeD (DUF308 family)